MKRVKRNAFLVLTSLLLQVTAQETDCGACATPTPPRCEEAPPPPPQKPRCRSKYRLRPILEGKLGYFFFSDSKMNDIYTAGGLDAQLSATYPVWKWLSIYGSGEYLERQTTSGNRDNHIWEIPLSLGLKPMFQIAKRVQYYFAVGPRYVFMHAQNKNPLIDQKINDSCWGGFVNTGFNFFPAPHFVIDLFGEYSYAKIHIRPIRDGVYGNKVQLGGFVFGGGLGYAF